HDIGLRDVLPLELAHVAPGRSVLLPTVFEDQEPGPYDLLPKHTQQVQITWHRIVRVVASEHSLQPFPYEIDGCMHASSQLGSDALQLRPRSRVVATSPNHEPALRVDCAEMPQSEEGEGLRFALVSPASVGRSAASPLDQASLIRVQFQPEPF